MAREHIRIPNTPIGPVFVECYQPGFLSLRPWWHSTCRLNGQKLPFFRIELHFVDGRWAVEHFECFDSSTDVDKPEWPRGARKKIPGIVLEIGAAWAAANADVIYEKGVEYLKHRLTWILDKPEHLGWVHDAIACAKHIDRMDLLRPIESIIHEAASEFSRASRKLSAERPRLHKAA
jgi:hypothetical protein